jgi:ribonuclease J
MNTKHLKKFPKDQLIFLPLGGSDEIGMNLNLYGYNDQWMMVDLGITFMNELGIEIAMPDITFIQERRKQLLGLVVTHGHEDHIGAIPYLWDKLRCPIYATPFTAFLVREKLREVGLAKEAQIIEVASGSSLNLGPFGITYVPITHSIPESHVLALKTPQGMVVHTGDWKLDDNPLVGAVTDHEAIKSLGDKGVLALVCDSTNVFEEGSSGSEGEVQKSLIELISLQKNRVVVSCFASNIARLFTCAVAAEKTGRKLIMAGRSLERMEQAARYAGYLKGIPKFLGEDAMASLPPEKVLLVCTGSQGEPRSALSRIAEGSHPRVKLFPGDTVFFSSRMIPGNEKRIRQMQHQLQERGLIVVTDKDDFIHVSGHPNQGELQLMYEWTRPQILVPVHGERGHIREQAAFGEELGIPMTIQPSNGKAFTLHRDGPQLIDTVHHGRWGLDGSELIPLESPQMRARAQMMTAGMVFVTLLLDKKGALRHEPHVTLTGVCQESEEEELYPAVRECVQETVFLMGDGDLKRNEKVSDGVRLAVRRLINGHRQKKPQVVVHIHRGA